MCLKNLGYWVQVYTVSTDAKTGGTPAFTYGALALLPPGARESTRSLVWFASCWTVARCGGWEHTYNNNAVD